MNFLQWRQLHKINQQDVCNGAQVSVASVIKYEKGEPMREATKQKIEKYIDSIDSGIYTSSKKDYTPKSMSIDDLWCYLPKDYNYIAMDKNGVVYAHRDEPSLDLQSKTWISPSMSNVLINVAFDSDDWTQCMAKRPYNYWDYIGKIGIFSDNGNLDYQIIGKLERIEMDNDKPFKRLNGFSYSNFRPLTEVEKEELA